MDDRYLFFALEDPDFFDLPWIREGEPAFAVPPESLVGFGRSEDGPWLSHHPPGAEVPEGGWKIHVSARPSDAQRAVEVVARVAYDERVSWKVVRNERLLRGMQHKYAPLTLSGKVCALYPRDTGQLARLVTALVAALEGVCGPRIHGDHNHPSAPIGLRWGAFREHWLEAYDGRLVPGMSTADGLVPDDRRRIARELPAEVADLFAPQSAPHPLPINDVRMVHRCNAGAVYRAQLEDGRWVALKEARHYAGYDGNGTDAVTRLRHEHAALKRLAGSGISPEAIDYWEAEHADFLVMDWVEGEPLGRYVSWNHPGGQPGMCGADLTRFNDWVDRVGTQLAERVDAMHRLGVAHGDLTPGNVVLGADGPVLVDFEAATLEGAWVTRTIATPGFHLEADDPFARDRFSLERTLASLREPDLTLVERRPDLAAHLGLPASGRTVADVPGSTEALIERLVDDLLMRATPERTDRLFPGGTEQFTTPLGGFNLLSGAAGVLLALQSVGHAPTSIHLDWLASVPLARARMSHGLVEGAEGVSLALALLGRADQATLLVDSVDEQPPTGLSWSRGKAGYAVALAELGTLLDRTDLGERAADAIGPVLAAVHDSEQKVAGAGLYDGWSGIALALLRFGELVPEWQMRCRSGAGAALRRERLLLHKIADQVVAVPGRRVRIGFGSGSAAFALAVAHLSEPGALADEVSAVSAGLRNVGWPMVGLMDGLAGTAVTLRALGDVAAAARLEERARWHCAPTARGWSTLGAARLRCSDDVMTGSAGLICALGEGGEKRLAQVFRLPGAQLSQRRDDTCHDGSLPIDTATRASYGV